MEKTDVLHIIPKNVLRKLFLSLILAAFILTDFYFLHFGVFKVYDQLYLVLYSFCLGIIYNSALMLTSILAQMFKKEENKKDSYTIDMLGGLGTIFWICIVIVFDKVFGMSIVSTSLAIFIYPAIKIVLSIIRHPKNTFMALKALISVLID